ncbi:hypothetical protein EVAR_17989_1 [Eumeta japonica]|uniref:Uncharacterized protein n=1 Tax=Eumeta variegata TaxID=151549 RepID=A0A4C1Y5M7_EUMVA|nr:hypothetical protein EVAR_17989_1 [Eumeta japonica]
MQATRETDRLWLLQPKNTCNPRKVTSASPSSWVGIDKGAKCLRTRRIISPAVLGGAGRGEKRNRETWTKTSAGAERGAEERRTLKAKIAGAGVLNGVRVTPHNDVTARRRADKGFDRAPIALHSNDFYDYAPIKEAKLHPTSLPTYSCAPKIIGSHARGINRPSTSPPGRRYQSVIKTKFSRDEIPHQTRPTAAGTNSRTKTARWILFQTELNAPRESWSHKAVKLFGVTTIPRRRRRRGHLAAGRVSRADLSRNRAANPSPLSFDLQGHWNVEFNSPAGPPPYHGNRADAQNKLIRAGSNPIYWNSGMGMGPLTERSRSPAPPALLGAYYNLQYNARNSAAPYCLRVMQCAGLTVPDSSFFSSTFLFYVIGTLS